MIDDVQLGLDDAASTDGAGTIEHRFERFHEAHPEVYRELVRRARRLTDRGYTHLGMKMLWEVLRYRTMLGAGPDEEPYRLNNNYTSHYARLIMETEPDLSEVFETRELRAD